MRFLNILLAFLLTAGTLQSQIANCDIFDLVVTQGDCTSDSTFKLSLDFQVANPANDSFEVWTQNNQFLGVFALADLPVGIADFPTGNTGSSFVRVCIQDNQDCCEIRQFLTPNCSSTPVCEITNLAVFSGDCNPDGTFKVSINFSVTGAAGTEFEVWTGNGQYLGAFPLNQLPLQIPNYPASGNPTDNLKVCIKDNPDCCASILFDTPDCPQAPGDSCEIRNLRVRALDCTTDNNFALWLNFSASNTNLTTFSVFTGSGQLLGVFNINQLPLVIPNFPWNGQSTDAVTVCFGSPSVADACCKTREFNVPTCIGADCDIKDLKVNVGSCTSDSTYKIQLSFVTAGVDSFELYAGNGLFLGTFGVNQLPLALDSFPGSGEDIDYLKVCIKDSVSQCCRIVEFSAPRCRPDDCGIFNFRVSTGDCADDGTYHLTISFESAINVPVDSFAVYSAEGVLLGFYSLADLPLTIPNYPWNGEFYDAVKVCVYYADTICCSTREFLPPDCVAGPCDFTNITVETGPCNSDGTYKLKLNFQVNNAAANTFNVWSGNGAFLGTFNLSDLPITFQNFPWSGGTMDAVKICLNNGAVICCEIKTFDAPDCMNTGPCEIFDVNIQTGDCNNTGGYKVTLNFQVQNPPNLMFEVWAGNGQYLGIFPLNQLPVTIQNFPASGNDNDVIKICINDTPDCCRTVEFPAPDCPPAPCEITNLTVITGDCTSDSTYVLKVDFDVQNPGNNTSFGVWANGEFFGAYNLNNLPLTIQNFPWNGGPNDVIKVCLIVPGTNLALCCETLEFPVPACLNPPTPCEIFNLVVDPGACTSDSTYTLVVNFQVQNGGGATHFGVWANGVFLDTFPLSALPLTIQDFPWNGGQNDFIKVCLLGPNNDFYCCRTLEFLVPDCLNPGGPCEIFNLVVDTGDCTSDSTYNIAINFDVQNPGGATHFGVWINGVFLDTFPLSALPLQIPNVLWDGGTNDAIKVCLLGPNNDYYCCRIKEFPVPACLNPGGPCEIYDLVVDTGDCTSDSTYSLWVNFQVQNAAGATQFGVWANNVFLGVFPLSALPLQIDSFPWNGGFNDVIKVCLVGPNQQAYCCRSLEFPVPGCLNQAPCEIYDLTVLTGDCTSDSTYVLKIDFEVQNPGNTTTFGVWANGEFFGVYNLNNLPLIIQNFPWNGGPNDVVKVCLVVPGSNQTLCCRTLEFPVPDCLDPGGNCEIFNLHVDTGDCTSDSTYVVTIDFDVQNGGGATHFALWANGVFYDNYPLSTLPLTIQNFPWNGGQNDFLKVCLLNANGGPTNCCAIVEFPVPACLHPTPCDIVNLHVDTGNCTSDSTYELTINFDVQNPANTTSFGVWANGEFLGVFNLNALPLTIPNFPWNGGQNDVVKVCLVLPGTVQALCCETLEFPVPDCLIQTGPCEIYDLSVTTGDCTSDSTYVLKVDFEVQSPGIATHFGVWANGVYYGDFPLSALPLTIQNFPWNGGQNDFIKVCILDAAGHPTNCCAVKEFPVPDCLGGGDCHIYDLVVLHTPCLCGQFFAIITFEHSGGGNDGFKIVGNGNNYGNYPYNTQQPIIIGPLDGDNMTNYEFAVVDLQNPDCADDYNLGKVDCTMSAVQDPATNGKMTISPNPTSQWLQVSAQINGSTYLGQGDVDIIQPDGRLARTTTVANAGQFTLDVSDLPAGLYRLLLKTASGRLEGTFVKQ